MRGTLLFTILVVMSTAAFSQVDSTQRPFYIKHGKITYEFFSGTQKGTKVFIFDKWGEYSSTTVVTENDTAAMRKQNLPVTISEGTQSYQIIKTPDCIYQIDLNAKIGGKKLHPGSNEINTLTEANYTSGNKFIGKEKYMDRTCDVYVLREFMKFWYWNGICIKKELLNSPDNKTGEYSIRIDENYIPQRSDFKIPSGIKMR